MKRLREDSYLQSPDDLIVDCTPSSPRPCESLPMEMWHHIVDYIQDFHTWYRVTRTFKDLWLSRGATSLDRVRAQWPGTQLEERILLGDFVPASVLQRLAALPWARVFETLPYQPVVAGGYVRIEVIRALREEKLQFIHPDLMVPKEARDMDVWFPEYLEYEDNVKKTIGLLEGYELSGTRHGNYWNGNPVHKCSWTPGPQPLAECILVPCREKTMEKTMDGVLLGFDLTCCQFQFAKDWYTTGQVWTTPMAMYSLMTGRLEQVCRNFLYSEIQSELMRKCRAIIKNPPANAMRSDRLLLRIQKYVTQYGYTHEHQSLISEALMAILQQQLPNQGGDDEQVRNQAEPYASMEFYQNDVAHHYQSDSEYDPNDPENEFLE